MVIYYLYAECSSVNKKEAANLLVGSLLLTNTLYPSIKVCLFLEVTVVKTLETSTMTSLVLRHLVD